jgi:hypothetical protein
MASIPTSFRLPPSLQGLAHPEVVNTIQDHDQAINDLQQANQTNSDAIAKLQSSTSSGMSSSTSTVTENITEETVIEGTQVGGVDNQTGVTTYALRASDNGARLILNDASAIAVSLPAQTIPFTCWIGNYGAGAVTLTPVSPATISYGTTIAASSMPIASGASAQIFFDGSVWWA